MNGVRGLPQAAAPFDAVIRPPGSKSLTIRALVVAALAEGRSHLYGALPAGDTWAVASALRDLGIPVASDGEVWGVDGRGGTIEPPDHPVYFGESGLGARLGVAIAALADGTTTVTGRASLARRPMGPLVQALRAQGVEIVDNDGLVPVSVVGRGGLWGGRITVDCATSTQFGTALMVVSPMTRESTELTIEGLFAPSGYLRMTADVMTMFGAEVEETLTGFVMGNDGYTAGDMEIEVDASSAVYPLVAAAITGSRVVVEGLSGHSTQPDMAVVDCLETMGCTVRREERAVTLEAPETGLAPIVVDMTTAPDGAMALVTACLFANGTSVVSGLESWSHKESDRMKSLVDALAALGARIERGEGMVRVTPAALSSGVMNSAGDHRVAMAGALVGLRVPGAVVAEPEVVAKTWPEFWEQMEVLPRDLASGRP